MKLNDIISTYAELTNACEINQLGQKFTYYHAEELNTHILAKKCLDIDIVSAFPTICTLLFKSELPEFIKNIFQEKDKIKRNIYISTFLTKKGQKDNHNYLHDLNTYSKILILSYIYNNYKHIEILEYKKDGVLFKSDIKQDHEINHSLNNFFIKSNINVHINTIDYYFYFNKTSIYVSDINILTKGKFKNPSSEIIDILKTIILNGKIYDFQYLHKVKLIYSDIFFNILQKAGLFNDIKNYYSFNETNFINKNGKLQKSINELNPQQILSQFIYPVLYLLRKEK